jgi:hypothetical protein
MSAATRERERAGAYLAFRAASGGLRSLHQAGTVSSPCFNSSAPRIKLNDARATRAKAFWVLVGAVAAARGLNKHQLCGITRVNARTVDLPRPASGLLSAVVGEGEVVKG